MSQATPIALAEKISTFRTELLGRDVPKELIPDLVRDYAAHLFALEQLAQQQQNAQRPWTTPETTD